MYGPPDCGNKEAHEARSRRRPPHAPPGRPRTKSRTDAFASTVLKAARLLDVRKGVYLENAALWIEGDRIKEVGKASDIQSHAPKTAKVIDLGRVTLLPGLIDCHTHIMARIPEGDDGYILNLATKSQAFRALEGAYNARITLQAGYTTIRDVESEGSGYADVALRDAINQGLAEGPRMQVSTRAIAAVGQYNPFGVSPDLTNFPTGAKWSAASKRPAAPSANKLATAPTSSKSTPTGASHAHRRRNPRHRRRSP